MGTVEASGLTVRRGGKAIVDDVSVTLQPGTLTAILGPNGAGKSTLLRCLAGSLRPAAGTVLVTGKPVSAIPAAELARIRAVMTQENRLGFAFSVLQVVQLGRLPHAGRAGARDDGQAVAAALEATGIMHLADRDFTTLSGGEKQRVHLARALAQIWPFRDHAGDRFLLLDEPTNNLDLSHQHRLLGFARGLADAGLAIAAVLHDPNLAAAYAHRAVIMQQGRVMAEGPTHEIMTAPAISRIYGLDLQSFGTLPTGAPLLFASGGG
jgi:iron complex transport system ATP-binding protein